MTILEAKQKVLDLARAEIGYHEKASNANLDDPSANSGGANWTKYAYDLDRTNWYNGGKNGYAWCDVFVDWLFFKAFGDPLGREMICQPTGSCGAGCLYSAQYYKSAGRWHTNAPQVGDQIFFSYSPGEYSHTGIVEQVNGDTVTTIEGNTSDSVGRRQYNIGSRSIAGYGRPKWELAQEEKDKPWIVVENGQVVNSSEWAKDDGKETEGNPVTVSKENHEWTPPLLKYAPDDYYEACKAAQALLNCYHFDCGKADGYFGVKTQAAVNKAIRFYGIEQKEVIGTELWEKLGVKVQ